MGEVTGIEWTDATYNPWRGCTKVSPGCKNCYMYREMKRYGKDPTKVVRASPATFNAPLRWKGPRKVFTCSWSDFFHEAADPWRDEAWEIIRKTPHLTYQILTKRPERILGCLPGDWNEGERRGWPNVWLGVSGEDGRYARERGLILSCVEARVHFLSAEPAIGPYDGIYATIAGCFDWVIAGGESGAHHRHCDSEWIRQIRNGCIQAGVPFFFKQWGGPVGAKGDHDGAILDGRLWKEMPA